MMRKVVNAGSDNGFFNANELTGTIPTEVGQITGISTIFLLKFNSFKGTMPTGR